MGHNHVTIFKFFQVIMFWKVIAILANKWKFIKKITYLLKISIFKRRVINCWKFINHFNNITCKFILFFFRQIIVTVWKWISTYAPVNGVWPAVVMKQSKIRNLDWNFVFYKLAKIVFFHQCIRKEIISWEPEIIIILTIWHMINKVCPTCLNLKNIRAIFYMLFYNLFKIIIKVKKFLFSFLFCHCSLLRLTLTIISNLQKTTK